jgi:hypothetical protein
LAALLYLVTSRDVTSGSRLNYLRLGLGVGFAWVVHDRVFEGAVLRENTFDYFAQDRDGNVWYFGEDTEELDRPANVVSTEGT